MSIESVVDGFFGGLPSYKYQYKEQEEGVYSGEIISRWVVRP